MLSESGNSADAPSTFDPGERFPDLPRLIAEIADLLPAQGPISAFVFLNTLQGLETLPYHDAVELGSRQFGCEPYLSEEHYQSLMQGGRISPDHLAAVIREDLGAHALQRVGPRGTLFDMRLAMLRHQVRLGPPEELAWYIAETDALSRVRSDLTQEQKFRFIQDSRNWILQELSRPWTPGQSGRCNLPESLRRSDAISAEDWNESTWQRLSLEALWHVCVLGVEQVGGSIAPSPLPVRPRDYLVASTGTDPDLLVNTVLVPLCAAFTDQGQAGWKMPQREAGLFHSFLELYHRPGQIAAPWLAGVDAELTELRRGSTALASLKASLTDLGIEPAE